MQIVIDIPEDEYEAICYNVLNKREHSYGYVAIANGTPLPKGHGRIVDIDNAVKDFASFQESFCAFYASGYEPTVDYIGEVLIEADKETDGE